MTIPIFRSIPTQEKLQETTNTPITQQKPLSRLNNKVDIFAHRHPIILAVITGLAVIGGTEFFASQASECRAYFVDQNQEIYEDCPPAPTQNLIPQAQLIVKLGINEIARPYNQP